MSMLGTQRTLRGGGMGLTWDDVWGTAEEVVTSPTFWGAVTGEQAAQAPASTIIYQTAPAPAPAAGTATTTNYTPWLIGGGVLLLGGLAFLAMRKK